MPPSRTSGSPAGVLKQTKDIIASISFDLLMGKVAGFTSALVGVYLSARKIQEALRESAGAEALKNQLIALGQSASQAETKVASLAKMAANGAVSFESLGNAAKILRVIGGAAADTEGNLKQISDVFAASGAPVAAVATAYAQFFQAIKQGGDVSSAAQDMANLGGISQDAAQKIRDLSAAGASSSQILRTMQTAMDSTKGASEALRDSVVGLQAQLKNLEQENNVKLGENFIAGEKAGLRAQIAFEKLKNTLASGIAETIAPIKNAWAQLVQKIAESKEAEGGVRALSVAIQGLIYIAAGATLTALGGGIRMLISLFIPAANGVARISGILGTLGSVFARVAGLVLSAGAAWTVFGAALTAVGVSAYNSYQNIKKLNEEAAKKQEKRKSDIQGNSKDAALASTTEEQRKKVEDINDQIGAAQKAKEANQKELKQADEALNKGSGPLTPWGRKEAEERFRIAQQEDVRLSNHINVLNNQRSDVLNQTGMGVGPEENERLKNQALLERNIRNESVQQLQSQLSPRRALDVAKRELEKIQAEKASAQESAPKIDLERKNVDSAAKRVVETAKNGTAEEFQKALADLENTTTTTEASQLHKEAAYKTTLREEGVNQQDVINSSTENGKLNPKGIEALKKAQHISDIIYQKYGGDSTQITPEMTQNIERKRDVVLKTQDTAEITRREQAQKNAVTQIEQDLAAQDALVQKQQERAILEAQLASLSNSEANAEFKAGAAGNQRVAQLQKAKAAAEDLDKATQAYQDSIGTPEEGDKKAELQKAQISAAKAGVEGRSTSEIDQELNAEKQILQVKLSAARVAENASKAEYDAAQRRLALERQMVELRASQAEQLAGRGYGVKGQNELTGEAQDVEIAKKQEALDAARARDAAEAANKANPTQETEAAVRAANEKAASLGVTPDTKTRDVESQLNVLKQQRADTAIKEANTNNRSSMEMQIQGARIQEQYAPSSWASQSAKQLADNLEDQLSKADRVKELTSIGMKGENAEKVADIEVQRSRILSNIDKEGNPEVSSMARIGGSSGWAGMVGGASQDKQAKLEQLNQQMVTLLAQLAKDSEQSMSYARVLLNGNK